MDYFFHTRSITLGISLLLLTTFTAIAQREFGVDVSHYQGSSGISQASWNQMYAEGKRFAFIKATEGLTGPDDAAMANNVARAKAAGVLVGVYHFAHPENRPTPSGAVQEADHLLEYAGAAIGPGYLRPVLDLEGSAATLGTTELTDWVIAFCDRIAAVRGTNAVPIIYCNQPFANYELDSRLAGYDLWLRTITSTANLNTDDPPPQGYPTTTGVFGNWSFWQYSATGSSGGISPLDLNVCHSEFKSLESFLIPDDGPVTPPSITTQPLNKLASVGDVARFTVSASGTPPLKYQWQFNGTNLVGATRSAFSRSNIQLADAGAYSVVVTNAAGSVSSSTAALVITAPERLFEDDFDDHVAPSTVTSPGTALGYDILFGAASGATDFSATFGFDYSSTTHPLAIPSAPGSTGGTTKGLRLTVNKDATGAAAAVNLYPANQNFSGNVAFKFDFWINWTNAASATEQALFGFNHSGTVLNRIGQASSDGLFFAVSGDGGITSTSIALRDYSVFRGGGPGVVPFLMLPANTTFGPTPLLGTQFDSSNSGFANLFPSKAIAGYPSTVAGSAGMSWISAEVRQEGGLITWMLNDTVVAQYTNTFSYTNGNIMLGYSDYFASIGDLHNYVIFDNVRVEAIQADSDGSGLPDSWEVLHFGQLGVELDDDADGDGVSNGHEFVAGTNPTNAVSRLRMLDAVQMGNDVLLSWSAVGGRNYQVQWVNSTNGAITSNFTDLSPVISMAGTEEGTASYLHIGGAGNSGNYYRVRVNP